MFFFLDIVVSKYLHSCFFLNILNSKNIYYIIFIGLVLDFIVANTGGKLTFLLLSLYFINKVITNFFIKNIFNFLIFYFLVYPFGYYDFLVSFLFYLLFIIFMKKAYY